MKVLVIDDLQHDKKIWDLLLKDYPAVETIHVSNADEAKDALAENPDIDAVFTDHHLGLITSQVIVELVRDMKVDAPLYLVTGREVPKGYSKKFKGVLAKGNLKRKLRTIFAK